MLNSQANVMSTAQVHQVNESSMVNKVADEHKPDMLLNLDLGPMAEQAVLQLGSLSTISNKSHKCKDCARLFLASEVLIDETDPLFSWDSSSELVERCFACYKPPFPDKRAFGKASTKARSKWRYIVLQTAPPRRLRSLNWDHAKANNARESLSNKEWRRVLGEVAMNFTPDHNRDMAKDQHSKACLHKEFAQMLSVMFMQDETATQNVEGVVESVDDNFICRWKTFENVGLEYVWQKACSLDRFSTSTKRPMEMLDNLACSNGIGSNCWKGEPNHGLSSFGCRRDNDNLDEVGVILCEWKASKASHLSHKFKETPFQLSNHVNTMDFACIEQELVQRAMNMQQSYATGLNYLGGNEGIIFSMDADWMWKLVKYYVHSNASQMFAQEWPVLDS